jgi:hypothetical protein
MRRRLKKHGLIAIGIAGAVLTTSAAVAFATGQVIGSTNTINACYRVAEDDRKGEVRAVSDPASCRFNELPLAWNIQGPKGDVGAQGPQGDRGPSESFYRSYAPVVVSGITEIASLSLPAGSYNLTAKTVAANPSWNSGALPQCTLALGSPGSAAVAGDTALAWVDVQSATTLSFVAAGTLSNPGRAFIACRNNSAAATPLEAAYTSIAAVRVATVTGG